MIKIKVVKDGDFVNKVTVSGHAKYDVHGKDIVCAAVSSIVITSCNLALKLDDSAVSVKDQEGLIDIVVLKQDEIINKVLLNMIDMLKELAKDYDRNVKII